MKFHYIGFMFFFELENLLGLFPVVTFPFILSILALISDLLLISGIYSSKLSESEDSSGIYFFTFFLNLSLVFKIAFDN